MTLPTHPRDGRHDERPDGPPDGPHDGPHDGRRDSRRDSRRDDRRDSRRDDRRDSRRDDRRDSRRNDRRDSRRDDRRDGLRDFYENPAVPVASGPARSLRQARMLAAALGTAAPGGGCTVLDIGCGDGTAAATAAPLLPGHRVVGVDWSQDALIRARTRLPYAIRGELTDGGLPFRTGSVDAVLFSEVVEHLVDPDAALDEIRRVLRPGGHLMLSTPNLAAWYNRGLLAVGVQPVFSEVSLRAVHGRPGREVVGHLRLYTARALRQFVTAAGFGVVRLAGAPFHGVPRPLRALDRLACARPPLASILLLHARRT